MWKYLQELWKEAQDSYDDKQNTNPIYLPPLFVQVLNGERLKSSNYTVLNTGLFNKD